MQAAETHPGYRDDFGARPPVQIVRNPEEVHADGIEQAADEEASDAPLQYVLNGETFTARRNRPQGAWAVFCARLKSKNTVEQTAAVLTLLKAWTVPEDHDRLDDAVSLVDDLEQFVITEFRDAVEAMMQRPSPAP